MRMKNEDKSRTGYDPHGRIPVCICMCMRLVAFFAFESTPAQTDASCSIPSGDIRTQPHAQPCGSYPTSKFVLTFYPHRINDPPSFTTLGLLQDRRVRIASHAYLHTQWPAPSASSPHTHTHTHTHDPQLVTRRAPPPPGPVAPPVRSPPCLLHLHLRRRCEAPRVPRHTLGLTVGLRVGVGIGVGRGLRARLVQPDGFAPIPAGFVLCLCCTTRTRCQSR
jgi:hypothetical protein